MIEKQHFTLQRIISDLKTHYNIAIHTLTPLSLGADLQASVYKATTNDGLSYFVKLKQDHYCDIGTTVLALLQATGIQPIIPPVKTTKGNLSQHLNNFTLTVYPFVTGQNGFCRHLTNDQWIAFGKALRQVHEVDVPLSIKSQIQKETYSNESREAVRALAYRDKNLIHDETSLKLQLFITKHELTIHRLVERAEFLSQKAQQQPQKFVLCHSDIHAGNVLIAENNAIYLIDWDEPIMAPKERDLMFIGGGVANTWNNPDEEHFFYHGYRKSPIDKLILAYYRHERIVQDIAEYTQMLLWTSAGGEEREQMYKHFLDMFKPDGVVDIAFKTDDNLAL